MPGSARVYEPLTPLPLETLPELFIHPAGYCQNVLATGRTWISGTDVVAGREAIDLVRGVPGVDDVDPFLAFSATRNASRAAGRPQ